MNTCCAGAALTTRSKRGSTGVPATFGISALRGGSRASRTAVGCFDAACRAALSISATMLWSTLYGPAQETSKAATNTSTLIRFMGPLLTTPRHLEILLGGGPALRAPYRRIELDGFGPFGPLQDDLLVADPHQSRVVVAPAQNDPLPVDRRPVAIRRDDHDLSRRRIAHELGGARATAENFPGRARGIVQSLRKAARRAERDDERETQRQISSHVLSGLNV